MSNFNFNEIKIGGRLTSDPVLRTTPNGVSVASFSVAVNRRKSNQDADFFNVVAWRNAAEVVSKFFKKGSAIFFSGEVHNKSWTDENNVKHYGIELTANDVYFVDSKNDGQASDVASDAAPVLEPVDDVPF